MAWYIVLAKFTEKGRESMQEGPRSAEFKALAESLDIQVLSFWVTMGRYDVVGVFDAPDDETMAQFLITAGGVGTSITETLRAFSDEEVERISSRVRNRRNRP